MIYVIQMGESDYYKIGYTDGDPQKRITNLQTGNPFKLTLVCMFDGDMELEAKLHHTFRNYRKEGEWFILGKRDLEDLIKGNIKRIHEEISASLTAMKDTMEIINGRA